MAQHLIENSKVKVCPFVSGLVWWLLGKSLFVVFVANVHYHILCASDSAVLIAFQVRKHFIPCSKAMGSNKVLSLIL